MLNILVLVGLLVLPVLAAHRQGVDFRWLAGYGLLLAGCTYAAYSNDKRRAQAGEWRWPETVLHILEFLGGWPGAFLAQRWVRHKSSKVSYQVTFWLIVLLYQFLAFDSLRNWQLSRAALEAISDHR